MKALMALPHYKFSARYIGPDKAVDLSQKLIEPAMKDEGNAESGGESIVVANQHRKGH